MSLALALAGVGALGKLGTGIFQGIKANKIEKNNIRPVQEVQSEYFKNVAEAEQMARNGMPQEQYNLAKQNIGRNQSAVLNALGRGANSGAGLNALLRASNDATLNLDARNAAVRNDNRRVAFGQRGILAAQKQNAFDWNRKSKYLAEAAKAQALRGAGAQNIMGAFNDVSQIGSMMSAQENGGGGVSNLPPMFASGSAAGQQPSASGLFNATKRGF